MRLPSHATRKTLLQTVSVLGATILFGASCQDLAGFHLDLIKWKELRVLSSAPVKDNGDGTFSPMCRAIDQDPYGLEFRVLLHGTEKKGSSDRDRSIKPGDYLDKALIKEEDVTTELFELNLHCLEPLPDEDLFECSGVPEVGKLQNFDVAFDDYESAAGGASSTVALAILIDMSGSMVGLVEPAPSFKEPAPGTPTIEGKFEQVATDFGRHRFTAVETLLNTMNATDPVLVFVCKEGWLRVVTGSGDEDGLPVVKTDEAESFFSTSRDHIIGKDANQRSALDHMTGEEEGRTPLWYCLKEVYEFMQTSPTAQGADFRHNLVVGDGPDTCAESSELSQCGTACQETYATFEEMQQVIEAELAADQIPIPTHFVQMEAWGYQAPDARQAEIACLTGGHYIFSNVLDVAEANRQELLNETIRWIRYTFRGYWTFTAQLASLRKNDKDAPDGWVYALAGTGKVLPGDKSILVTNEAPFRFDIGANEDGTTGDASMDRRISFRKECNPDTGEICPKPVKHDECTQEVFWCDEQALTCKSSLEWTADGEASGCKKADVRILVALQPETGSATYEEVKQPNIPTLCCDGMCRPPKLPQVPNDLKSYTDESGNMVICFTYGSPAEWRPDPDNPGAWVADATLKIKGKCPPFSDIEGHLMYANTADLAFEKDWDCPRNNCYAPPGAGGEE
jgi:hypothetical protein